MSGFGDNVRWRRLALGLSQAGLANAMNGRHDQAFVSRIESGALDPRLSTIRSLARALHVKPWVLVADVTDSLTFWQTYLELTAEQKREVQRHIDWLKRGHR